MKISIDKHILYKPLEQAAKFISSKTVIPILSELLIEANDKGLFITGGNGTQFLRTKIDPDDFQMITQGSMTIPGKKIVEIVKVMKGVIDIESGAVETSIKNGRKKYELPGMDANEYPEFVDVGSEESIVLEGKVLKSLVKETAYAASENEATPILTGLRLRIANNLINVLSTDRHRLSSSNRSTESAQELQMIIGAETMTELVKLIAPEDKVEFSVHSSRFVVKTRDFVFFSSMLEGVYPDVDRIVPTSFQTEIIVNRGEFIEALNGLKIIVKEEKTKLISMYVGNEIILKAAASGGGKADEIIDLISINGEGFNIAFNGEYALEAAESLHSDKLIIGYSGRTSPMMLSDTDDERNFCIVLPYRTAEV